MHEFYAMRISSQWKKKKFVLNTEEESCHLKSMILSWGGLSLKGHLPMCGDILMITV